MNKRIILSILLIGVLMFGAGMGTIAYYAQMFTSEANEVAAAAWEVSAEGGLFEEAIEGVKLAPGQEQDYDFSIDKAGTEVPVEYWVSVVSSQQEDGENAVGAASVPTGLFDTGSPIQFRVTMNGEEGPSKKLTLNGAAVKFPATSKDTDEFVLNLKWPWGSGIADGQTQSADVAFAGLSGNFTLKVEARQGKVAPPPVVDEPLIGTVGGLIDRDWPRSDTTITNSQVEVVLAADETVRTLTIKEHPVLGTMEFTVNKSGGSFDFNNSVLSSLTGCKDSYINGKVNSNGWKITTNTSYVTIEIDKTFTEGSGWSRYTVQVGLDLTQLSDPTEVHSWFRP